jgi:hypothetical protein
MQNKGQADGNAIPVFLPAMIQDFPGNTEQKKQAEKAAMQFIKQYGSPSYKTISMALDFFSTVMKATGK